MTALQVVVLAIVQGVTELFPVSSLGHAVILPPLLHWGLREDDPGFLPFLVVMHLGTAGALLLYLWRDWLRFAGAVVLNRGEEAAKERALFWRVVVATIPAVVVGFALERLLRRVFSSAEIAAAFLVVNGLVLFGVERLKRKAAARRLDQLGWGQSLAIGACQCFALIPGISRSGVTMAGGLLCGLDHEDAARFSFLSGTPIILAATVHEAPKLMHMHGGFSSLALLSGFLAGAAAFASTWVLMHWFKRHGGVSLALLLSHVR